MGSHMFEILTSNAIPGSVSYILCFFFVLLRNGGNLAEKLFFGTFFEVFALHPLAPQFLVN